MSRMSFCILAVLAFWATQACSAGETRDQMVRSDKAKMEKDESWIYNDPAKAFETAKKENKPLMVVLRCIPCEACKIVDEDVAARDAVLKDLMDKFVCLRIVQANSLDLSLYQFDYDMSWAVLYMNADKTIYARFGTKFEQKNGDTKASLNGLRKTMEAALACHQAYPGNKEELAGKQPKKAQLGKPEDFPKLKDYGPKLDYEGAVAKSCVHCHMVRDADREYNRASLSEQVVYPYPMPETIGLGLDPAETAKVASVTAGSAAEKAGLKAGDTLAKLDGQPIYSIADVAWVLHHFTKGELKGEVRSGAETKAVSFKLEDGWRRQSDLSWRTSTWNMRRMGFGGMILEQLPADERKKLNIAEDGLALRVKWLGQNGLHATALRAGVAKGDIIVEFDGQKSNVTESQLLGETLLKHKQGEDVKLTVLRGTERKEITFKLQ